MTSLAAGLGMLPLAYGIGSGADMLKPLAIAVIGALCISVVLSLIATPSSIIYCCAVRHPRNRALMRSRPPGTAIKSRHEPVLLVGSNQQRRVPMTRLIKLTAALLSPTLLFGITAIAQTALKPKVIVTAEPMARRKLNMKAVAAAVAAATPGQESHHFANQTPQNHRHQSQQQGLGRSHRHLLDLRRGQELTNQVICVSKGEKKVTLGPTKKEIITTEDAKMPSLARISKTARMSRPPARSISVMACRSWSAPTSPAKSSIRAT